MSITRKRAGRKSWETRHRFNNAVGDFFEALASAPKLVFDSSITKTMIVERTTRESGKKEVITFSQSYGELSMWLGKAFENISDYGFSDMLAETFLSRAAIHTNKAEYRLWNAPKKGSENLQQIDSLKMAA